MLVIKNKAEIHPARGSVLIEFALIALVLYLILAATIEFGRACSGHRSSSRPRTPRRGSSRATPLPASTTLKLLIEDNPTDPSIPGNSVPSTIYSENWLVVNLANVPAGMRTVDYCADAPIVNQLLLPLMVVPQINGQAYLQYPGALTASSSTPTGYTVMIPVVSYAGGSSRSPGRSPSSRRSCLTTPVRPRRRVRRTPIPIPTNARSASRRNRNTCRRRRWGWWRYGSITRSRRRR